MGRIPLLVIAGPTAAGKTRVALDVAEAIGGEIINADSMQIYRGLDLGTAKPTREDRERVGFHLLDVVDPDQPYTVATFQREARRAAEDIAARGRLPILCGGTGLYVRAVVEGFRLPPRPQDLAVRERLTQEMESGGPAALHARLEGLDPVAAQRIHVHDRKRLIRALEVIALTGRPLTEQQAVDGAEAIPYNAASFVLSRPREALYEAIERRVEQMLAVGWLDEARGLQARGYPPELQSMQALGYRWLFQHLKGELGLGEATRLINRDTRRFAKRQLTWLRHQTGFTWLSWTDERDLPHVLEHLANAAADLKRRLARGETP